MRIRNSHTEHEYEWVQKLCGLISYDHMHSELLEAYRHHMVNVSRLCAQTTNHYIFSMSETLFVSLVQIVFNLVSYFRIINIKAHLPLAIESTSTRSHLPIWPQHWRSKASYWATLCTRTNASAMFIGHVRMALWLKLARF